MHSIRLLLLAIVSCAASVLAHRRRLDANSPIAIIGGGVSGLSSARTLRRLGYTNVTIFEAGASIVPLQHRYESKNAVYDMDLIYVPALHWDGVGVQPEWASVLAEYDQSLVRVAEYDQLLRVRNASTLVPVAQVVDAVGLANASWVFFSLLESFYREHQYGGVAACLEHGIADADETWAHWISRHSLTQLATSFNRIMGLYGNFPIATYPACQVVMMLANKSPSNLAYAFAMYANASTTTSPVLPLSDLAHAWMIAVLDPTNFMRRFQHGYGRFFAKIVRADGLVFETRANVSAITPLPATDQVQVSFIDGHDRVFDAVIVAARPNQIASALPPAHPMTHLYTHVGRQTEINTNTHGVYGVAVMVQSVHH
ncbi:Aste57867_7117 [Aphanomyces stellatus]|uniref:Aste57867_7117 protein n=2 Tax=Aphanomyces stellatus TaxID=120398 RepID=A0A485KHV2_9STRA|nr:hypothetical protein As57867_007093 [Aphanomyces stellatus]VFT84049.1 Aste57867_7117 [Aphanomyces stellatus]